MKKQKLQKSGLETSLSQILESIDREKIEESTGVVQIVICRLLCMEILFFHRIANHILFKLNKPFLFYKYF